MVQQDYKTRPVGQEKPSLREDIKKDGLFRGTMDYFKGGSTKTATLSWDVDNDPFGTHEQTLAHDKGKGPLAANQSTAGLYHDGIKVSPNTYAPDGMKWSDGEWNVTKNPNGEMHFSPQARSLHDVEKDQRGWYEAESTRVSEAEYARRNFGILIGEVAQRHANGKCPSGMWTNDPAVFPLFPPLTGPNGSQLPNWDGGVQSFPPDSKQFFKPEPQAAGTTKLLVTIETAMHRMKHSDYKAFQGASIVAITQSPTDPEHPYVTRKLGYMPEVYFRESTEFLNFKHDRLLFGAYIVTRSGLRHDFQGEVLSTQFQEQPFYGEVMMKEVLNGPEANSIKGDGDAVVLTVQVKAITAPKKKGTVTQRAQERKFLEHKREFELVPWARLVDYGASAGASTMSAAHVFNSDLHAVDCGRVIQGHLHNRYMTEALNAISTRPKLAEQIFYCWDVGRSVYILRLMVNGTWVRVEIDDYIPPVPGLHKGEGEFDERPLCCHSEFFPWVLWPSLVEKAYAKVHTIRPPAGNKGGWEVLGGPGRTEEALADLTGGVAGRFSTRDASPDRLFVYFYWLQRYCLWVARPSDHHQTLHGATMNRHCAYVVKRAAHMEGHCYLQLFHSGESRLNASGLETHIVPDAIINGYPEKGNGNYFWMSITDFCHIFDTVIECRLVNSPDVGAPGMPPPSLPRAMAELQPENRRETGSKFTHLDPGPHYEKMDEPLFYEHVLANQGSITADNLPEFDVHIPEQRAPCEVVAVLQQTYEYLPDPFRETPLAILLKVYQHIDGNSYNVDMVCRSNWLPIRDSMVCFRVKRGGRYKIHSEFPPEDNVKVKSLVFRCYTSQPGCEITASKSLMTHNLVRDQFAAKFACKWTLVGCANPTRLLREDEPEPWDEEDGCGAAVTEEDDERRCSVM